jgi:hypothetical protein
MKTIVPIAIATVLLAALGAAASSVLAGGGETTQLVATGTAESTTVRTSVRDDARKAGTQTTATVPREPPVDISGPCDEAEHANDPRCAPGGEDHGDDDRAGRGRGSSGHGGHDDHQADDGSRGDDDRSGSNSGPG